MKLPELVFSLLLVGITISWSQTSSNLLQSAEPPIIPIGLDAFLQWEKIPYQRIGVRAYMRSTYDRQGNNRTADASHFLYQEADDFNVTLDVKGPGILYFKRTNHWHGSPWHYEIDGKDFIVQESATSDPVNAKNLFLKTVFIPENLFPHPLTWTWTSTHGADLMWVPLPFQESFRIAYSRTFYGTGYYIYHLFPPGIKHISRPLISWDKTEPPEDVLELIEKSGTDLTPKGADVKTQNGEIELDPFQWITVADLLDAPSTIRALKFVIPQNEATDFGKTRLRITWDRRWEASIDTPLELFYGAGQLYNNNQREFLVKGFPINVRYVDQKVHLASYWPMPFFQHAKIELQERSGKGFKNIHWELCTVPFNDPVNQVGYFHATYKDIPKPRPGEDIVFLDTRNAEGSGEWSGNFVGMSWIFSYDGILNTLEGDPRFFFDDSKTPQAWGTGTEEWGGGGDYWGGRNMTIPFAGHPVGQKRENAMSEKDLVNSAYRFLISDIFPFGKRAIIGLEHGAVNRSNEHYTGVVYWYGIDSPTLVLTDQLNVCNRQSIKQHNYISPSAEEPYTLVSRYEWGSDGELEKWESKSDFQSQEQYFPAEEDQVRIMRGSSWFTVNLDPKNLGVLLRRKFDYLYPNQQAKVYVRPAETNSQWNYVNLWYTAGSNSCVYSNPRPNGLERELAPTEHHIITSNRRWRDEEFLIPRHLTGNISKLEIKIDYFPLEKELYPGQPFPNESAWSASRYWVYCYRMPEVKF
jgi:hypothetical protein